MKFERAGKLTLQSVKGPVKLRLTGTFYGSKKDRKTSWFSVLFMKQQLKGRMQRSKPVLALGMRKGKYLSFKGIKQHTCAQAVNFKKERA